MKILFAVAMMLFPLNALACPEGTISLHDGEPMTVYCYDARATLIWLDVVEACLTHDESLIAYEAATDGARRVSGMCQATFEFRY